MGAWKITNQPHHTIRGTTSLAPSCTRHPWDQLSRRTVHGSLSLSLSLSLSMKATFVISVLLPLSPPFVSVAGCKRFHYENSARSCFHIQHRYHRKYETREKRLLANCWCKGWIGVDEPARNIMNQAPSAQKPTDNAICYQFWSLKLYGTYMLGD